MIYDKGQLESREYPKDIPINVGACIRAKRCKKCGEVYFVNDDNFTLCRSCKPIPLT